MTIVMGKQLRKLSKVYKFGFDREYQYITSGTRFYGFKHGGESYKMDYVDGCFYPYLFKINE